MKKIIMLLVLVLGVFLFSCQKEELTPTKQINGTAGNIQPNVVKKYALQWHCRAKASHNGRCQCDEAKWVCLQGLICPYCGSAVTWNNTNCDPE